MLRVLSLLVVGLSLEALAQPAPRLGVVIVVDQLALSSFDERLPTARGGFKRLVEQGLRFRELRYEVAPTLTSAGHATLATGAWASVHGVVSNEWIEWETGKPRLSTEDKAHHVLGRPPARQDGTAPTLLRVPTLGDALKVHDARAKVVSISGKDRSAILLAGRGADAVLWFDAERPMFTSSSFYAAELPPFVAGVNRKILDAHAQRRFHWDLDGGAGRQGDSEPDVEQPELQPLIDGWQVDLALDAVGALGLGGDDVPDLLCLSFSGHDRIGHTFGAESAESKAEFTAVDVALGRLLDGLDRQVGKGRWVAVLTSDHGVAPVPEGLKARRLDAGRVDLKALRAKLEQRADELLGPGEWFAGSKTPGLTATPAGRAKVMTIAPALRALALEQPGVLDLLDEGRLGDPLVPWAELWRRGYVPGRSPDLIVVTRPYWLYNAVDPTGHASHWLYDRLVPLVFAGAGVRLGAAGSAEAIDVAPTLARLLGVPAPVAAQGKVLDVFR